MNMIQDRLFAMQDLAYRDFHSRLMPNIDKERVIGVRTPLLRKYAKELAKDRALTEEFMRELPHKYYEENNLHAFLIENLSKAPPEALILTEEFLPYIDNWATCDSFSPKAFKKDLDAVYLKTMEWIKSPHEYTVRYGIVTQMKLFLDDGFRPEALFAIAGIRREEYYINMAIAWYLSFALIKQYEATIPLFTERRLSTWVHNKVLQKAIESYRVDQEKKDYFRGLKIK